MNFNWKRIPIGIGRTQQRMLDVLEKTLDILQENDYMVRIKYLAHWVYHPESGRPRDGKFVYTKSEYNTIHRAVRALEKRGLVTTNIYPVRLPNGRDVYIKEVGLPETERESK